MEKRSIMEVINENKGVIIKRALIVAGIIGGLLLASKALSNNDEEETLDGADVDGDIEEAEFSEVETEE